MRTKSTKKDKTTLTEKSLEAAERIGQTATFVGPQSAYNRGLLKKEVVVRAYKTNYGKIKYLVEVDGARSWVMGTSLVFNEGNNNRNNNPTPEKQPVS